MTLQTRFSLGLFLALSILLAQVGGVFAAPALQNPTPVSGVVQSITLAADTVTGVTTVSVDVLDNDSVLQSVRVNLEVALAQGFVVLNGDGKPVINDSALGKPVKIERSSLISADDEDDHPIANALATFFSDIDGIDYETIMAAHEQGMGFGVLAQILWLTTKLEGDSGTFEELVHAKQTGDFSSFILEDGTTPGNWGQLKKAILDKKNGLGVIISNSNDHGNGNDNNPGNNGNPGGNGNGSGNGNGNSNGGGNHGGGNDNDHGNGNKDKDRDNKK